MWNDPLIGIDWKTPMTTFCGADIDIEPVLSEKDTKHPAFDPEKNYFDMTGTWLS